MTESTPAGRVVGEYDENGLKWLEVPPPPAHLMNQNLFAVTNLQDGTRVEDGGGKFINFTLRSRGRIRPGLIAAIQKAHRGLGEPVPVELGDSLAIASQGSPRPRPSREDILDCYRACAGTQELDGQPLYERFALLVLERWGR